MVAQEAEAGTGEGTGMEGMMTEDAHVTVMTADMREDLVKARRSKGEVS